MNQTDLLWSILPHPSPEHVVRVAYRKDGKMVGDYARNLRELRRFTQVCTGRRVNAYCAPNPTEHTVGTRHSSSDVTHWSYILVDIDPLIDAVNPEPMPVLEEALLLLGEWLGKNLGGDRCAIIDSGRGAQAWIRLDDVPLFDKCPLSAGAWVREPHQRIPGVCTGVGIEWKWASKAMSYWLKKLDERIGTRNGCRVDTSTSDLPRLMRLPGTFNVKTGREARIVQPGTGPILGLASLMLDGTPKEVFVEHEVTADPGKKWQMYFSDLTREAQQYLLHGKVEPGRHKVVWHTAKKLSEVGCSRDEARKAIRQANEMNGEEQELKPHEIEHALDTSYGRMSPAERRQEALDRAG